MKEVDIVDAHDNVVRTASLDEVHQKDLLHRFAQVMLFNTNGEVFAQSNDYSVSGHVYAGESYLQAAERLLHENLGVHITPKHIEEVFRFGIHENERLLVKIFAVRDFKDSIEEVKGKFIPFEQVEPSTPILKKSLELFKETKQRTKDFV